MQSNRAQIQSQEGRIKCSSRQAKTTNIKRYDQRIEQYTINRLFQQDQKSVYQLLNGKVESSEEPDTEESRRFWSNIWGTGNSHSKNVEWLEQPNKRVKIRKKNGIKLGNMQITSEMATQQTRQFPNWKFPGPNRVLCYWLKNFSVSLERMATQMDDIINNRMGI